MKYKVLKDFHTPDGVLYEDEVVKQWDAFTKDVNRRAIHDPDNVGSPAYGWPFGYGSIILGTRPH